MPSKIEERWNFHYITPEGHELYPFRHLITYSYLLDVDKDGKRSHQVDTLELKHRVLAQDQLFALWLAELEQDDIFLSTNKGVLTETSFTQAKKLIDGRYFPYTELWQGYTGHEILELIHSNSKKDAKLLTDITEGILRECLALKILRVDDTLIQIENSRLLWTTWVGIFSNKRQIQNTQSIIESMKLIKNFVREKPDWQTHYLLFGPAFGHKFSELAKGELTLLWSLSIINFLRELRVLRTEVNVDSIQACFPEFFQEQQGKIAHSTSIAFEKVRRCLNLS
ncbi:MAG: hypothetical protein MUF87_19765 [Anaerolineae bacterium]|jgi:hypothetical protein|nr:hypothetical protein [Anaerolineae bacterium]